MSTSMGTVQQTTAQQTLPTYVTNAGMTNLTGAYSAANNMLGPYSGPTVANMTPYTQNVIGSGLQAIDAQGQQALDQNADQATAAGAFGGSRQGVVEGATNAATALDAGQLASQLQQQNYTN